MRSLLQRKIASIIASSLLIFLIFQLKRYPNSVEKYYSDIIYVQISSLLQISFNFIPFSVGDVFYLVIIAVFGRLIFNLLRSVVHWRWTLACSTALSAVLALQLLIVIFYLLWGINYFRPPAAERLGLNDSTYTQEDLIAVATLLVDSANATRARISETEYRQNNQVIIAGAVGAVKSLGKSSVHFRTLQPNVKPSLISYLLNYLGTAGYYNPFTTEAQINAQMPVFLRPFTACHEMAHQMGYNREDEANFVGYIAATGSSDKLLQYSAYYHGVREFMFEVMLRDTTAYKMLSSRISAEILNDFKTDRDFWLRYHGNAGIVSSLFYNQYLKINNQPEGLRTYNRMIKLTMAWYGQRLKAKETSPGKPKLN